MCICNSPVPDSFLSGMFTFILKRGEDPNLRDSFRPITVACNISKLFEHFSLPHVIDAVNYDVDQFGFKKYVGCQHAH